MATAEKTQYEAVATQYNSLEDLPHAQLEKQLVTAAIGDCTNLKVLDIGGGSGLHARKAVDAGATVVDVVDVSPSMLQVGQAIEARLGRPDKIRWHVGDATQAFSHLPLESGGYDVVMANWVFDHATTRAELHDMWANVCAHIKPRGKLVNIRVTNFRSPVVTSGKYGVHFEDVEEIPGGARYTVHYHTQPPFSHEGTSMEESYSLSAGLAEKYGFEDMLVLPPAETEVAKSDPEFYQMMVEDPNYVVLTARKKA
ncbi:hypothetical protein LTR08_000407 [Meristemomyces frigidus]|nr:hypothetical protein LTR08_000407 [Meristemomyces frigidus]